MNPNEGSPGRLRRSQPHRSGPGLRRARDRAPPRPDASPEARILLDAIPIIGFHLVDAIRAGKVTVKVGSIDRLVLGGVTFSDGSRGAFDHIILATGFAPALDSLGALIQRDERGFAMRHGNVTSADHPGLLFVGQRYDSTGALANIKADAIEVGRTLAARA